MCIVFVEKPMFYQSYETKMERVLLFFATFPLYRKTNEED